MPGLRRQRGLLPRNADALRRRARDGVPAMRRQRLPQDLDRELTAGARGCSTCSRGRQLSTRARARSCAAPPSVAAAVARPGPLSGAVSARSKSSFGSFVACAPLVAPRALVPVLLRHWGAWAGGGRPVPWARANAARTYAGLAAQGATGERLPGAHGARRRVCRAGAGMPRGLPRRPLLVQPRAGQSARVCGTSCCCHGRRQGAQPKAPPTKPTRRRLRAPRRREGPPSRRALPAGWAACRRAVGGRRGAARGGSRDLLGARGRRRRAGAGARDLFPAAPPPPPIRPPPPAHCCSDTKRAHASTPAPRPRPR
jgi:hypothetical protein